MVLPLHSSRTQHLLSAEETRDAGLSSASVVPAECHGLFISRVQFITEVASLNCAQIWRKVSEIIFNEWQNDVECNIFSVYVWWNI